MDFFNETYLEYEEDYFSQVPVNDEGDKEISPELALPLHDNPVATEMDKESTEKSANKVSAAEDEANTAPLTEKVSIGGSLVYKIEKKLDKGGFGQVYAGSLVSGSIDQNTRLGAIEVVLKFEHRTSKGCNYGQGAFMDKRCLPRWWHALL